MTRRVVYSPRSLRHLRSLYEWISSTGTPERAERFAVSILDFCDGLSEFPFVGIARDDILFGLRTIGYRHRVTIAFKPTDETVEIHGIYYGGRDFENRLQEDTD